ncbi:YceG family protein [Niallia taxi]|uniref:YceG family protein n=1 Tax=Niallia taxi TaxID=2499688 RepID=UPI002040245F|nr:YceG family protein [Niallia taxi]MCM3215630.1 YceG family protein [Niallia taxi]
MNVNLHTLNGQILPVSMENWYTTMQQPLNSRPFYKEENGTITFGQVFVKLLGVPMDEDEYYNQLYDWVHSEDNNLELISNNHLNRVLDNKYFQAIQKVLNVLHEQNLSVNRFVAFLDGENLILKSPSPSIHRKLRESMIKLVERFAETEPTGLKSSELRRVLVDVIKWSINHLQPSLEACGGSDRLPQYLWYGTGNKSQAYFLTYLSQIGCDLVIASPNGDDVFEQIAGDVQPVFIHRYPQEKEAEEFPTEKRRRTATVAYRASKEIESILNHEGSGLYKPWQLRDYTPMSVTLKTTYDELFLLEKEKAMIRPNFEVSNGEVKIPTIFAKVFGVSSNRKEYWDRMHTLVNVEHALLIKNFPFTRAIVSDYRFHYRNALGKDGKLDIDKMMGSNYWSYGRLPIGLQKGIASSIRSICHKPRLQSLPNETSEEAAIFLFTQGLIIPADILKLLQKFDYSQDVPSIILYKTEQNGIFTREDAAILLLLNAFGVDIILYNPPGHMDMEPFITEGSYDSHWLEDVVFELEYKEESFFKKMILNGFKKNRRGD